MGCIFLSSEDVVAVGGFLGQNCLSWAYAIVFQNVGVTEFSVCCTYPNGHASLNLNSLALQLLLDYVSRSKFLSNTGAFVILG